MLLFIRDELHRRMQIIAVCISGCAILLPMWNDVLVEGIGPSSMVARQRLPLLLHQSNLQIIEACVSRKFIADLMHRLYGEVLSFFILFICICSRMLQTKDVRRL